MVIWLLALYHIQRFMDSKGIVAVLRLLLAIYQFVVGFCGFYIMGERKEENQNEIEA